MSLIEICKACEHLRFGHFCSVCKCNIEGKTKLKEWFNIGSCPKGKW